MNIGNALLFHLPSDLALRGNQVNIALSVFFVTYCVFEIPANVLLKRMKPQVFREFLPNQPWLKVVCLTHDPMISVDLDVYVWSAGHCARFWYV